MPFMYFTDAPTCCLYRPCPALPCRGGCSRRCRCLTEVMSLTDPPTHLPACPLALQEGLLKALQAAVRQDSMLALQLRMMLNETHT